MKRLLLILALLSASCSAQILQSIISSGVVSTAQTPAVVQNNGGVGSLVSTLTGMTSGNYAVSSFAWVGAGTLTSVVGSRGGAYSLGKCITNATPSNITSCVCWKKMPSSGDETVTITVSGTANFPNSQLSEWSNIAATSPLDATGSGSGSGANPSTTTSGSASVADGALISYVAASTVPTATDTSLITNGGNNLQWRLSGSSGAIKTSSWTASAGDWVAVNIILKPGP